MLTIQSTSFQKIEKRIRHPDILKYKIHFIQENRDLFHFLFVIDWRDKQKSMKGRMPPKKENWSPAAIEFGNIIKNLFRYNSMSDPKQIMFHFRRLYFKLYVKQIIL